MKTIATYNRIISGVRKISGKTLAQKPLPVTKPDMLDIPRKPKLSRFGKLKKIINDNLTNLNKKNIKELENCSLEEFLEKSQNLIIASYKIPKTLAAVIKQEPTMDKKAGMMYSFTDNVIGINPKLIQKSRRKIFAFLKHECTHQKQNYQILRTEKLGEKAIEEYTKIKAGAVAEQFVKQYSGITDKELQMLPPMQQIQLFPWIYELRQSSHMGEFAINKFKEKVYIKEYPIILKNLKELRQKVIKELGLIPENTEEAKVAEQYFNDFMALYKKPLDIKANLKSINETEAYGAQFVALYEYLFHKFI